MKSVYFMKPKGMEGPIKIGCSTFPAHRRNQLQHWSPFPLELLAEFDGTHADEAALHAAFKADRLHGEWFQPSPKLLHAIEYARRCHRVLPSLKRKAA